MKRDGVRSASGVHVFCRVFGQSWCYITSWGQDFCVEEHFMSWRIVPSAGNTSAEELLASRHYMYLVRRAVCRVVTLFPTK